MCIILSSYAYVLVFRNKMVESLGLYIWTLSTLSCSADYDCIHNESKKPVNCLCLRCSRTASATHAAAVRLNNTPRTITSVSSHLLSGSQELTFTVGDVVYGKVVDVGDVVVYSVDVLLAAGVTVDAAIDETMN